MLLYLTNIGDILAKAFRYLYSRACACTGDSSSSHDSRRRRHATDNYRVQHVVGNASSSSGRYGLEVDEKFHLGVPPPPPPPLSHIIEDDVCFFFSFFSQLYIISLKRKFNCMNDVCILTFGWAGEILKYETP